MAGDLDLLPGKWIVKVKPPGRPEPWTWEYEFFADGTVKWRDLKSAETGAGAWAASSKFVNMSWKNSETKESWVRPLSATPPDNKTWYASSYFTGNYKIEKPACPGFLTDGPFKLDVPVEVYQTGLLCWAAGSESWLRTTKRGSATFDELRKKYKAKGKLDADDALPESNIVEVFDDIGIAVKTMPAADFTFCFVLEKLKTKGHMVLMAGSGSAMGHTRIVYGVGDPTNEFFNVFDPLTGHGYDLVRFNSLSGTIYVGWAK